MTGQPAGPGHVRVSPPARLRGRVHVPGDKSISHRAAILNAVASGRAEVSNFAPGDDCRATVSCLRRLGVEYRWLDEQRLVVHGNGLAGLREPDDVLDCGNSGTTMRLLAGLLASRPFFSVLTGDASLRSRPMGRVIEPLRQMGASLWGRDGDRLAPIALRGGRLHGMRYHTPVASAQVKSAILLAGLGAEGSTEVVEPAPSRDHTERMLAAMGAQISRPPVPGARDEMAGEGWTVRLAAAPARLEPLSLAVPGDFSSAAYWLAAACLHPDASIVVEGVGLNPGRIGLLHVLRRMGAQVRIEHERLEGEEPVGDLIVESSALRAVDIGGDVVPSLIDELPLLAVLACRADGVTRVRDAGELRYKESDRIAAMTSQLRLMGATIEEHPDGWTIEGPRYLRTALVESSGDHRVAMALAVAGLAGEGVTIGAADCVTISYPGFWSDLARLGVQVETA